MQVNMTLLLYDGSILPKMNLLVKIHYYMQYTIEEMDFSTNLTGHWKYEM